MSEYAAKTLIELRNVAKDLGLKSISTLPKADLLKAIEAHVAKGDPANFANMPDEIEPVPEKKELVKKPIEKKSDPAPAMSEKPGVPPPEPEKFKLTNDVRFMKPDGTTAILKAGRTLKANEYDLGRVRASGGVLAPIVEK